MPIHLYQLSTNDAKFIRVFNKKKYRQARKGEGEGDVKPSRFWLHTARAGRERLPSRRNPGYELCDPLPRLVFPVCSHRTKHDTQVLTHQDPYDTTPSPPGLLDTLCYCQWSSALICCLGSGCPCSRGPGYECDRTWCELVPHSQNGQRTGHPERKQVKLCIYILS